MNVLTSLVTFRHKRLKDTSHVSAHISSEAGGISCLAQGRHDTLQLYERIHTAHVRYTGRLQSSRKIIPPDLYFLGDVSEKLAVSIAKVSKNYLRLQNEGNKLQTLVLIVDMSVLSDWVAGVKP